MSKQVDMRSEVENEIAIDSASPSLVLDRVSHSFGARCVFSNICVIVRSGQILIVSGANGSGKSTLLRVMAGLLAPSAGTVAMNIHGRQAPASEYRGYIGYVAPDLVLYSELTGAENLQFFAELHGVSMDRERAIALLTQVGLRGRGRDFVGAYSSGMRQRLKYAFALLHDPPVLLLDEPTANLDAAGAEIVDSIVTAQRQRQRGGLAVIATNEARELSWSALRIDLGSSA